MKILIIITRGDSIGGAQTHVLSITKKLINEGNEVLVAFGGATGPFSELLKANNINYRCLKYLVRPIAPLKDFLGVFEIRKLIESFNPEIISLHSTKAGILGRLTKPFFKKPFIVTVHGWAFTEGVNKFKSFLYKTIEKALSSLADKIIVVSNFDRQIAEESLISNNNNIIVIHNGVENEEAINLNRTIVSDNRVNFVMIARFDKQKDHKTLVYACKDLENIKVHLLGDGPELPKIKQLVNDLGISEKFQFWGYSNDVNQALGMADIFLLISNWEGFPISTLEAMNYSLPVIVSDVGGASEAVIENINGFCIKRGDIENLKKKLKSLIADKSLRRNMGNESKKILAEKFTSEIMYRKTVNLYRSIISSYYN